MQVFYVAYMIIDRGVRQEFLGCILIHPLTLASSPKMMFKHLAFGTTHAKWDTCARGGACLWLLIPFHLQVFPLT